MINNHPLISVIIPCYNVSEYVEVAVQSILKQTYKNLEVWIIDDASTDDTLKKIKSIDDKRIKIEAFEKNTQKVGAVNEVLKKIKGAYIIFQDADDYSQEDRIAQQLDFFLQDPTLGICFTNYQYVGDVTSTPGRIAVTDEELKNEFLNYGKDRVSDFSPTICGTMMISKAALEFTEGYHPYFAGRIGEDVHWIYRILKHFKGITANKMLYSYRKRKGSLTYLQSKGKDVKFSYSWDLVAKIIHKDIYENVDVLSPANTALLKELELEACETALSSAIQVLKETIVLYETSTNFRIGKFILSPFRYITSFVKK